MAGLMIWDAIVPIMTSSQCAFSGTTAIDGIVLLHATNYYSTDQALP